MTKEKRIEAITWLIEQAEAVKNGIVGVEFENGTSVSSNKGEPDFSVYGVGFYELALAASQPIKFKPSALEHFYREYFIFDGVEFYRLVEESEVGDAETA